MIHKNGATFWGGQSPLQPVGFLLVASLSLSQPTEQRAAHLGGVQWEISFSAHENVNNSSVSLFWAGKNHEAFRGF